MQINSQNRKKLLYYLSLLVLLGLHFLILLLIHKRMPYLLDSDMASEMVLGKLLSQENGIMSKNWFYSTEIRVLNTQLLYSFFFHFTDNWHYVRLLSDIVLHGIFSASTIFLCRKAGCGKYGFMTACCMILAMSPAWFWFMLMGCYYIPHVAISFLTLSFLYMYIDTDSKKKRWILIAISFVVSFIAGLGGIRQLVITYLPLFLTVVLLCGISVFKEGYTKSAASKKFLLLPVSVISLLAGGMGFVINNSVLSKIYHFKTWDTLRFALPDFDQLRSIISDILITLGYTTGEVSFKSLICNCACAVITILGIWSIWVGLQKGASKYLRIMTVFFLCNLAVFVALYTVTDMAYTVRYNFPVIVFIFPLIALAIHEADLGMLPRISRQLIAFMLIGSVLVRGGYMYRDLMQINRSGELSVELSQIADFLKESDYKNGYASFWNANVMTELTNGEVTMYSWTATTEDGTSFNSVSDIDALFEWLQACDHLETPPQGKVFALYRKNEAKNCNWKQGLLHSDIIFETANYTVYGYQSYKEMRALLADYSQISE